MDEYDSMMLLEHDVWLAWKVLLVKAVSQTKTVKAPADE